MTATSLEQSKRVLELGIKPDTADMWWHPDWSKYPDCVRRCGVENIPAWSLTSLWDLIPVHIITDKLHFRLRMDKGENDFSIWYDDFNGCCVYEDADFTSKEPFEATIKMIEWLCKNSYLGK